uniref:Autophagy related 16 like 2 n=1 Tax=Varanus komodoensis TaxID=61221 RepID=A0A8D2LN06_VARKO
MLRWRSRGAGEAPCPSPSPSLPKGPLFRGRGNPGSGFTQAPAVTGQLCPGPPSFPTPAWKRNAAAAERAILGCDFTCRACGRLCLRLFSVGLVWPGVPAARPTILPLPRQAGTVLLPGAPAAPAPIPNPCSAGTTRGASCPQAGEPPLARPRRLAALGGQLSDLEAQRRGLRGQAEERSRRNGALKGAYEALHGRFCQRDGELRRASERGVELLRQLMQQKTAVAERENRRIERWGPARAGSGKLWLAKAVTRLIWTLWQPTCEASGGREGRRTGGASAASPFASQLDEAHTPEHSLPALISRLKRGNSVSSISTDRCYSIPYSVVSCLPSSVSDMQEAHASEVNAVKFSPNSSLLATGGVDRLIRLWNVAGGRLEKTQVLQGANGSITSIEFDPLVSAAESSLAAGPHASRSSPPQEVLTGHTDKVTAARFRSTQWQAVTGSRDRTVREWDLGQGACSRTIQVFSYCNDLVCCDSVLVSGHHDKTIRFWDSRAPLCTQVIPVDGKVTSLSLSQDQMHLLSCSRDNALKVIDLRMQSIQQVFRAEGFKCGSDGTKAVFSPDKSYALAGSADGTLFLWNVKTDQLEGRLPGVHRSSVNAVAWVPSGTYIGSVDRCKTVVLWR